MEFVSYLSEIFFFFFTFQQQQFFIQIQICYTPLLLLALASKSPKNVFDMISYLQHCCPVPLRAGSFAIDFTQLGHRKCFSTSVAKGLNLKNATNLPNHAKNHATKKTLKRSHIFGQRRHNFDHTQNF